MDQHLGASITMSFALVVVFAIVLYQPENPPENSTTAEVTTAEAREPPSTPDGVMPRLTPEVPGAESPSAARVAPPSRPARDAEGRSEEMAGVVESSQPTRERRAEPEPTPARLRATVGPFAGRSEPHPWPSRVVPVTRRRPKAVPVREASPVVDEEETVLWRSDLERRQVTLPSGRMPWTP